jgi:enoyl-CoA hydratase
VEESVEISTEGKVRLIGLNRPAQRNAVDRHTARLLFQAFKEFNSDEGVHSAVLFGKGGNFCAGYDLKELAVSGDNVAEVLESLAVGDPQEMDNIPAPMVDDAAVVTCMIISQHVCAHIHP